MSVALNVNPTRVRHVKRDDSSPFTVLGKGFRAQDERGLRGAQGWNSGEYSLQVNDDGTFTLKLPNSVGGDGVTHLSRFLITADRDEYKIGEEWLEFYVGPGDGDCVFVGTPTDADIDATTITLTGADVGVLGNNQREFNAGIWAHAPRDVFELYTSAWTVALVDDFTAVGIDGSKWQLSSGNGESFTQTGGHLHFKMPTGQNAVGLVGTQGLTVANPLLSSGMRWEVGFTVPAQLAADFGRLTLSLGNGLYTAGGSIFPAQAVFGTNFVSWQGSNSAQVTTAFPTTVGFHTVAFEVRGRWVFCYLDGVLGAVRPWTEMSTAVLTISIEATFVTGNGSFTGNGYVDVEYALVRRLSPFLLRGSNKGDLMLPGAPAPGGLSGSYFNEASLARLPSGAQSGRSDIHRVVLQPQNDPYATRIDQTIDFALGTTWMAPGGTAIGEYFSVRWTGAIYLDLATSDRDVSFDFHAGNNGCRVYIGDTRAGQQVLDYNWPGTTTATYNGLRARLGFGAGWYPIVIEFFNAAGSSGLTLLDRASGGSFATVSSTRLSPYGCFESTVGSESFREMRSQLATNFGLQWTVEPRTLESGEFPGQCIPRVRQGRDTELVIDEDNSLQYSAKLSAKDSVVTMLLDAAGIADPNAASQLTAEAIDFQAIDDFLQVHQGYESLSDITQQNLLQQRGSSLLALHASPWQEVATQPINEDRKLADSFPLSGALAMHDWFPGDGVRLSLPSVGVEDLTPRQLLSVTWPITQAARGAPSVSFRQRPRDLKTTLQRMMRLALSPQRTYQGQLATYIGPLGTSNTGSGYGDNYSRLAVPVAPSAIVKAEFVVTSKSDFSAWQIEVNGSNTGIYADRVGPYDITGWVAAHPYAGSDNRTYGRLAAIGGSTGSYEGMIRITCRI